MRTLLIVILTVLHQAQHIAGGHDDSMQKTKCVCDCDDWSSKGQCDCKCKERRTECAPGYAKICPEKDGKCGGDTKSPLCPKDIFAMMEPAGRALDNWIQVKEVDERSFDVGTPLKVGPLESRKKDRIEGFEIKCDKIPKFKCDFIIDHTPTAVTSLKVSKCTHRKNFKKCPVTLTTKMGCTVKAFLYNKQKNVFAKGKVTIECTDFTTTPAPTTTTTTAEQVYPPTKAVGDGCICVPDFAMLMLAGGITGVESRQSNITDRQVDVTITEDGEEPERGTRKRGRVTKEVACKGVPKFTCDFIFDYEACSRINKLDANKCNHRKDVTKCPLKLETKDGCIIDTLLSNKGAKMIAGKTKISWGDNPLTGFMTRCVCLPEMVDSVSV